MQKQQRSIDIALLVLLVGSFGYAYYPVLKSLFNLWSTSDDYSHGFFIIPISIYIIWTKKEKLAQIPAVSSNWGGGLVVISLLMYLLAKFAGIQSLATFSIVPLLCSMVIYLFGIKMFVECLFPLAFLLFMLPIPSQFYSSLTNPLQLLVTNVTVWAATLCNIPVFQEGNVIHLPDRTLQVVEACSGLRSLITLLTLAAIFGYFSLKSNFLRIILFLTGVPAAIVVNIFRVFIMVIAFYYFDFDLTTGSIHTAFGMVIFVLAMLIVAGTKGVLSLWDR